MEETMAYEKIIPRARLGFMISSGNRVVEPEFHKFLPADIEPCITRVRMSRPFRMNKPFSDLLADVAAGAQALADSKCNVIAVHCTGASMSGGVDGDQQFVEAVKKATGKPSTTAAIGVSAALKTFGAKRVVFMTKEDNEVRDYEGSYLTGAGFEIIGGGGTGIESNEAALAMPPQFWVDKTAIHRNDKADAYFITCTNVRAMEAIEPLEKILGKPVITSNQALLWHALRTAGIREPLPNLGSLLRVVDSQYAKAAA
jgi:maleate isomerase